MVRSYITSAFAGALLLSFATAALAVTGEYGNMCSMGLPPLAKTYKPTAQSTRSSKARPIASAARRP